MTIHVFTNNLIKKKIKKKIPNHHLIGVRELAPDEPAI